jgi:hypothetical protein
MLKNLDLIATDIGLNYRGKTKYKSLIGGTLSILIISLTIVGLIYFGRELYEKRNPIMISSTNFNPMPSNSSLNPENFPFFLAVQDYSNNLEYFIDDTIYEMTARIYKRIVFEDQQGNVKANITKTNIKLEQCSWKKHFYNMEYIFGNYLIEKAWCIRPEDNHFIKGEFNVDEFYELQFFVTPCWNRTENNNSCKSQVEIAKRLDRSYVVYNYGYYFLSPKNFTTPLKRRNKEMFSRITTYTFKKVFSYMKKLNFTTDSGLVFEDFSTESYIQADSVYEVLEPSIPKNGDPIWSMDLRMYFNEDLFTRNYLKFQNLLAIMGGLYNGLIKISFLLKFILFKHFFWIDLMNDNFQIDIANQKKSLMKENILAGSSLLNKFDLENSLKRKNISETKKFHLDNKKQISTIDFTEKLKKLKVKKSMNFKFSQYINQFYCWCLNSKPNVIFRDIYYRSKNVLLEMLDINTIIQKQIDYNRFRYVILTEKEYALFNAIPQPSMSFVSDKSFKDNYFDIVMNKDVDIETIGKYFSETGEEEIKDQKIFSLFGSEFVNKDLAINNYIDIK